METGRKQIKTLQEERNSMIMRREMDTLVSDCVTNIQSNIIIHSKTQNRYIRRLI